MKPCEAFQRWLDEGRPASIGTLVRAHATECVRCAESEHAALDLELLLAHEPAMAPVGFTAAVVARVDAARAVAARWPAAPGLPLPWWVRVAAEPVSALALVLVALLVGAGDRLESASAATIAGMRSLLVALAARAPVFAEPSARVGLVSALAPLLWLAACSLYGASEAWVQRIVLGSTALPPILSSGSSPIRPTTTDAARAPATDRAFD